MLLDLLQPVIVIRHIVQQGLTWLASQMLKVGREVGRHLDIGVVLEGAVQDLQDLLESFWVFCLVQVEIFAQLPCSS